MTILLSDGQTHHMALQSEHPVDPQVQLGIVVKMVMRARDSMTQKQLAVLTGIEETRLSRLLRGLHELSIRELVAIADALKVEPKDLLVDPNEVVRSRWITPPAGERPNFGVVDGGRRDSAPSQRTLPLMLVPAPRD